LSKKSQLVQEHNKGKYITKNDKLSILEKGCEIQGNQLGMFTEDLNSVRITMHEQSDFIKSLKIENEQIRQKLDKTQKEICKYKESLNEITGKTNRIEHELAFVITDNKKFGSREKILSIIKQHHDAIINISTILKKHKSEDDE